MRITPRKNTGIIMDNPPGAALEVQAPEAAPSEHVILLGDSVFDCEHYTGKGRGVFNGLIHLLDPSWWITMLAVDGATTRTISLQLGRIKAEPPPTRLVVSIGGNNARMNTDLLRMKWRRFARKGDGLPFFQVAMIMLEWRVQEFAREYQEAMDEVLALGIPTTVCTIYNPDFETEAASTSARTALCAFNDIIIRYAMRHDLDILELRDIVTEPKDFELQIEPSAVGAWKIAEAISDRIRVPVTA